MRLTHLAVVIVLLMGASSVAQMRGGARTGFRGARSGVVVAPHHGVRFVGGFNNRPFFHRPFFPGVPASVTSLGPCGFTPCFHPFFRFGHGFRHFNSFPIIWGGGIWDSSYYATSDSAYATEAQPQVQPAPVLPSQLEVTIVDQRGEQKDSPAVKSQPTDSKLSDAPAEPAIFIFKDGTRKELANFAIMRGQLIDVTDGKIFRIPLEKLDREATLAANAKAGREIQLP